MLCVVCALCPVWRVGVSDWLQEMVLNRTGRGSREKEAEFPSRAMSEWQQWQRRGCGQQWTTGSGR